MIRDFYCNYTKSKTEFVTNYRRLTGFDMSKFTSYLQSILRPDCRDSVKSLALFVSVIVMVILSLCLGAAMIIDVTKDGCLDMDLPGAGIFELSLGGLVTGSGIPKILGEKFKSDSESSRKKKKTTIEEDGEAE